MNFVRRSYLKYLLGSLIVLCPAAALAQSPGKIEISKMNPTGLLTDKYSYMVQPYNFYYFHHMDELGFRNDVVRKGDLLYALKDPKGSLATSYKFGGKEYTLEEFLKKDNVTGFLVLHDDQIVFERYMHGSERGSRFVSQSHLPVPPDDRGRGRASW